MAGEAVSPLSTCRSGRGSGVETHAAGDPDGQKGSGMGTPASADGAQRELLRSTKEVNRGPKRERSFRSLKRPLGQLAA